MTSAQIRQSFLDFFAEKGHTLVPSSSLLPDSPGLLFTNAGMNQFVPIFLGSKQADVASWAGVKPGKNTRAADTQKCIRAGGKHNDLEDVGFDTYHHTLFEMLGNWSFGDYFKKESIEWGWELITKRWGIPAKRLFATVYSPDKSKNDPADFDQEAYEIWSALFAKEGLDPKAHIVNGNKKDNFWMMGETGPCGPCSEIHFNLLASDEESAGRALVNQGSPRCIEIWNHVFIQFNANVDGTFSPLQAKHVDTGMGFERVAGIYATTNGFKEFDKDPSNYAADVFNPLFTKITELSGKTYTATVPTKREGLSEQEKIDIAFRVLADHARCVSCAIADQILPGNEGRNYVVRRILRRGILYGTKLGLKVGFFEQLVAPVVESLGAVFPELVQQKDIVCRVIRSEEESFGRTLERGLAIFNQFASTAKTKIVPGTIAFELYDTYGFPLDLTQVLATERNLTVDQDGFEAEMKKQRERGRSALKREVVVAATQGETNAVITPTTFTGYTLLKDSVNAKVTEVIPSGEDLFISFNQTPFYAEMGGQLGDQGSVSFAGTNLTIVDTIKDKQGRYLHKVTQASIVPSVGTDVVLTLDLVRRRSIQRHHTATHLLNWALRKVLGTHVRQAGSLNAGDRLRFDFSHFEALTSDQLQQIEGLVNSCVLDNAQVLSYEVDFDKKPEGTLAFFGEKYGKVVRVVDIGGYSRELCGGTHVQTTGEIGLVKIIHESAVAAGTRRIEAVAGDATVALISDNEAKLQALAARLKTTPADLERRFDQLLSEKTETEKKLKSFEQKAAAGLADALAEKAVDRDGLKFVTAVVTVDNPEALRALGAQVIAKMGEGVVILGSALNEKATVVAFCSALAIKAGHLAGKIVNELSLKLEGKGGGKADFAMGGGKNPAALESVFLAHQK